MLAVWLFLRCVEGVAPRAAWASAHKTKCSRQGRLCFGRNLIRLSATNHLLLRRPVGLFWPSAARWSCSRFLILAFSRRARVAGLPSKMHGRPICGFGMLARGEKGEQGSLGRGGGRRVVCLTELPLQLQS